MQRQVIAITFFTSLLILILAGQASAERITFDSLGISGAFNPAADEFNVSSQLSISERADLYVVLDTFRDTYTDKCEVYINGILTSYSPISSGNMEVTIKIPSAFFDEGTNKITLRFVSPGYPFNETPMSIAPKSYIRIGESESTTLSTTTTSTSSTTTSTINLQEGFAATLMDLSGSETKVYNLNLYYYSCSLSGGWPVHCLQGGGSSTESISIKKIESELEIPFSNIREMEFDWSDPPSVTITSWTGEKIKGEPMSTSSDFMGKVDYKGFEPGDFQLVMTNTKKVVFESEDTINSPTTVVTQGLPRPTVCADWTPYGMCSVIKPRFCDEGSLVEKCSDCGCPPDMDCQSDGSCQLQDKKACRPGFKDCIQPPNDCETNIYNDSSHCGDCDKQCPEGYFCLLGSCLENTTENKEKLALYFMSEYQRYYDDKRYDDAKNYLYKARDVYVDIKQTEKVTEVDNLIATTEKRIENKTRVEKIVTTVFELLVALFAAVIYAYIFERKRKKGSLPRVIVTSFIVSLITFLVFWAKIIPMFYNELGVRIFIAVLLATFAVIIFDQTTKIKSKKKKLMLIAAIFALVSLIAFFILYTILF